VTSARQFAARRDVCAVVLIAAVVLTHRAWAWSAFRTLLDDAAAANPGWITWQYLPVAAYRDHLLSSLWYLQQTPPLPHLILGVLVKATDWPVGVARALYALQALNTAATGVLIFVVLRRLGCGLIAGSAVTLIFALSTDVFLMEINSFGQLLYETAGMTLVTAGCCSLCVAFDRRDRQGEVRLIAAAGLFIALAALTRASLSYLFAPLAVFIVLARGPCRAAVFLVPIVVLHGGWALKNFLVYGYLTPATSSWAGMNATVRLDDDGRKELLEIIARDATSPQWIVRLLQDRGYIGFDGAFPAEYLPPEIRVREDAIQARLGGTNPRTNSLSVALIAAQYMRAFKVFALTHKRDLIARFESAYRMYWQPMSLYTRCSSGRSTSSRTFTIHSRCDHCGRRNAGRR
jgi:hypothetical protein